ncbi:MAG TPA: hypothetical protein VNT55_25940 [Baekduia sp.]|nr:hypothetical protein [Baekduia sp.]
MSFSPLIAALVAAGALVPAAAPPAPHDPARSVALHAAPGGRWIADAPAGATLAWDLDADGSFDDAAGRTATPPPGARVVRVQAQWLDGPVPIVRTATLSR